VDVARGVNSFVEWKIGQAYSIDMSFLLAALRTKLVDRRRYICLAGYQAFGRPQTRNHVSRP
jgi:hypothetical protein